MTVRSSAAYNTMMGGASQKAIPTNGDTVVVNQTGSGNLFIAVAPAGLLLALTLTFPPGAFNCQTITVFFTNPVTSLLLNGAPILGAAVAGVTNGGMRYVWFAADNTWYRCG